MIGSGELSWTALLTTAYRADHLDFIRRQLRVKYKTLFWGRVLVCIELFPWPLQIPTARNRRCEYYSSHNVFIVTLHKEIWMTSLVYAYTVDPWTALVWTVWMFFNKCTGKILEGLLQFEKNCKLCSLVILEKDRKSVV